MDRPNSKADREQRSAVRFDTSLPVQVQGSAGEAHNVSVQGIYFESDIQQRVGALVEVAVEFTFHGRRHHLHCEGKVMRVERRGDRVGVGARLLAPFFDGEEQVEPAPTREP
jgi:hypothetical protein